MLALRIKKAVRKGATLVVADPRKIWLTKLAKRHLQLRPGTDVWLLNAMMHAILDGGPPGRGVHPRAHRRTSTRCARSSRATRPRRRRRSPACRPRHPRDRPRVRDASGTRRSSTRSGSPSTRAASTTSGRSRTSCCMTGHLGYESTGLERAPRPEQRPGPERLRARTRPTCPATSRSTTRRSTRKFSEAWGVEVPEAPGYRLDQIDLRAPRRPRQGALPDRREPGADRAERAPRRGGPRAARLHGLAGHLPERLDPQATRTSSCPASSFAEKDGTFTNTERRVNRVRKALDCPGEAREDWRDRLRSWRRALGACVAGVPDGRGRLERARRPLRRTGTASATTGSRRTGIQWPCPDLDHPGTPYLHAPAPGARRTAGASSSRSSTSRRSSSRTPSTRSSSRPAGRSTTTTRRR